VGVPDQWRRGSQQAFRYVARLHCLPRKQRSGVRSGIVAIADVSGATCEQIRPSHWRIKQREFYKTVRASNKRVTLR